MKMHTGNYKNRVGIYTQMSAEATAAGTGFAPRGEKSPVARTYYENPLMNRGNVVDTSFSSQSRNFSDSGSEGRNRGRGGNNRGGRGGRGDGFKTHFVTRDQRSNQYRKSRYVTMRTELSKLNFSTVEISAMKTALENERKNRPNENKLSPYSEQRSMDGDDARKQMLERKDRDLAKYKAEKAEREAQRAKDGGVWYENKHSWKRPTDHRDHVQVGHQSERNVRQYEDRRSDPTAIREGATEAMSSFDERTNLGEFDERSPHWSGRSPRRQSANRLSPDRRSPSRQFTDNRCSPDGRSPNREFADNWCSPDRRSPNRQFGNSPERRSPNRPPSSVGSQIQRSPSPPPPPPFVKDAGFKEVHEKIGLSRNYTIVFEPLRDSKDKSLLAFTHQLIQVENTYSKNHIARKFKYPLYIYNKNDPFGSIDKEYHTLLLDAVENIVQNELSKDNVAINICQAKFLRGVFEVHCQNEVTARTLQDKLPVFSRLCPNNELHASPQKLKSGYRRVEVMIKNFNMPMEHFFKIIKKQNDYPTEHWKLFHRADKKNTTKLAFGIDGASAELLRKQNQQMFFCMGTLDCIVKG